MAKKWGISPVEIEQRRISKGLKLSQGVTEHRLPNGTVYYTVRSESQPAKLYKIEWDQHKSKWGCDCPNARHSSLRCGHEHALVISLQRGLIHAVDSLAAARQRYQSGGVIGRK